MSSRREGEKKHYGLGQPEEVGFKPKMPKWVRLE